MAKYTMVFHGFLGDETPRKGPLSQEREYDKYPVIPRVGEEVITEFGALDTTSRLSRVRAVRHMIREGQRGEGVIVDVVPSNG